MRVAVELDFHFHFGTPDFLFLMQVCIKASVIMMGSMCTASFLVYGQSERSLTIVR